MIPRLSRYALCGCLVASLGCQNPANRSDEIADQDSFGVSLSFSSDDPAALETGRGHLPSLASELADHSHQADEDTSSGIPGGSTLTVQSLLERGHDADAHGRTQEAKMYYEEALAEDPNQPDAHHRLAILADRAGDFPRAEEHYRHALRGKPNDADVLNDLGYSCFLQGRAADSERYLNQARQIDPQHPHVSENLSLLYDPAKAEEILLSVMGPRQAQATLAQLFQHPPTIDRSPPAAPIERGETNVAHQEQGHFTEEVIPETVQSLQQKMEEARLRSIAERQLRNLPEHPPAVPERNIGLPQLPLNYPQRVPPRLANYQPHGVPDARINDAFRAIDSQNHSLRFAGHHRAPRQYVPSAMPPAYEPGRLADVQARPIPHARHTVEQRAAAPEWNVPPQSWPAYSQEASPAAPIEQTHHTMKSSSRTDLSSAAKRAAEIGMAAGPGSLFPPIADSQDSTPAAYGPAPAVRQLPGTDSRMNGSVYPEPGGHGVPTHWHDGQSLQTQQGAWGQPPASWNHPPQQSGRNVPANGHAQDPYDQMRAQHNAQFNHDQQSFAAQPGSFNSGPPAREALPTSFDPSRQDWPAYTREQYDARQMDQPRGNIPPQSGQGGYSGQTMPQIQPGMQQAPQNYGRSW